MSVNTSFIKANKWIDNYTWDVLKNLDQAARVYIKKIQIAYQSVFQQLHC